MVKLNAATMFREDALFRTKQEQEAVNINTYEAELRDCADFYHWQLDMRARDQKTRYEQIARTRDLARASAEEAQQARLDKLVHNRQTALLGVAERDAMQTQLCLEKNLSLLKKRQLVSALKQGRTHARQHALEAILIEKREFRTKLQQDIKCRLHEQDLHDKKRTKMLTQRVKQLKAEHSVHSKNMNIFDPTDASGYGLLDEMSLVEMHQRLAKNKKRADEERKCRRLDFIEANRAKQHRLIERIENIKRIRVAAAAKNHQTRQGHIERLSNFKADLRHCEASLLLKLGEDFKNKQQKLIVEEAQTNKNQHVTGADKMVKERIAQEELLQGAARMAKVDQRNCLGLMAKYEVGKRRDRRQIDRNHALENEAQKKEKTSGDTRVAEGTREMMKLQKQVIAKKKAAYLTQKKLHWEKMRTIVDPYTRHTNLLSITRAKRHLVTSQ